MYSSFIYTHVYILKSVKEKMPYKPDDTQYYKIAIIPIKITEHGNK